MIMGDNCICKIHVVFFLFKQKTAYEMRISDWSSDVCSSDLNDTASKMPPVCAAIATPSESDAPSSAISRTTAIIPDFPCLLPAALPSADAQRGKDRRKIAARIDRKSTRLNSSH